MILLKRQNYLFLNKGNKMEHLTEDTFQEKTNNGKVLLQFTAEWCGPCKKLSPLVEELTINKFKVDVDDCTNLSKKFSIRSVPTLVLLENGVEVKRFTGLMKKNDLDSFVNG